MNDHEIRELVKSELPYPQLTDRANIAFEKAYLTLRCYCQAKLGQFWQIIFPHNC